MTLSHLSTAEADKCQLCPTNLGHGEPTVCCRVSFQLITLVGNSTDKLISVGSLVGMETCRFLSLRSTWLLIKGLD